MGLVLSWLNDHVYAIRDAATENMKALSETFGLEWTQTYVVPKIDELSKDDNYLRRLTSVFAINKLGNVLARDFIVQHIFPIILKLAEDKVPNVRFNICKSISILDTMLDLKQLQPEEKQKIIGMLTTLKDDSDNDVQFYANESIKCFS